MDYKSSINRLVEVRNSCLIVGFISIALSLVMVTFGVDPIEMNRENTPRFFMTLYYTTGIVCIGCIIGTGAISLLDDYIESKLRGGSGSDKKFVGKQASEVLRRLIPRMVDGNVDMSRLMTLEGAITIAALSVDNFCGVLDPERGSSQDIDRLVDRLVSIMRKRDISKEDSTEKNSTGEDVRK